MKNHYKILRIPNFSNKDEIKRAYLSLVKIYHPDVNNGNYFFNDYFVEIKNSYDFLIIESNKLKFDDILKHNPELFNSSDLQILDGVEDKIPEFDNQVISHVNNKKQIAYLIGFLIAGIFFFSFIWIYGVFSHSTKTSLSLVDTPAYVNNGDDKSIQVTQEEIPLDTWSGISSSYDRNVNLQNYDDIDESPHHSTMSSSTNRWKENISAEINGNNLIVINKNKFTVFRVDLVITYKDDEEWLKIEGFSNRVFTQENHPFSRFENQSWFNISPGVTTLIFGDSRLKRVMIKNCEMY